jgi:hypothetical protein
MRFHDDLATLQDRHRAPAETAQATEAATDQPHRSQPVGEDAALDPEMGTADRPG